MPDDMPDDTPDENTGASEEAQRVDTASTRSLTPAMLWTLVGVGVVVLVGIIVAVWLFTSSGAGNGAGNGGDDPAAGAGSASQKPTATSTAPVAPGPIPGATPTTGSEVQDPETGSPQTDPNRLPPLPTPTPLVTAPLPGAGSAEGELVAGFPASILGPAPGADVISSSIATEGDTMQVTLVARTDAPQDEVRTHYRTLWSGLGLSDAGGSSDLSYADTFSSLSLAFTPASGTGTVYMIYAVLRTT